MTTLAAKRPIPRHRTVEPFDRILAGASLLLLVAVFLAIVRGHGRWAEATSIVWLHLITIAAALALTVLQMGRPKGGAAHRILGRVWVALMFSTAVTSLFIVDSNEGRYSAIHVLSVVVIVIAPLLAWWGYRRRIEHHKNAARGMVVGSLLLAGFFTFPFDRLLGGWLFG